MTFQDRKLAFSIYLYLGALFITSLVVSNLIFQKFFQWQPLGNITILGAPLFELSVGILPYPLTFLITDLIFRNLRKEKSKPNSNSRYLCLCFFHGNIMDCQQNTGNASLSCKQYYIRKCIRIITNCRFSLNARLPICSIYRHFNLSFLEACYQRKTFMAS